MMLLHGFSLIIFSISDVVKQLLGQMGVCVLAFQLILAGHSATARFANDVLQTVLDRRSNY